jgi:uncharacterized protein YggE
MEEYGSNVSPVRKNKSKIITVVSLVLIALFTILAFFKSNSTISTVSVAGKADISAKADYVKFVVTKVNTGTNVSQVIDDGNNVIDRLVTVVKTSEGAGVEIKKTFYQISGDATAGYSVANAFSIKTSNVDDVGLLIKKLYEGGVTNVSNVTFESKDIKNVEEKLRKEVYVDANDKAKRIAKSAGKRLGRVISIVDDDTSITSTIEDMTSNGGLINISKSASVIYKIW